METPKYDPCSSRTLAAPLIWKIRYLFGDRWCNPNKEVLWNERPINTPSPNFSSFFEIQRKSECSFFETRCGKRPFPRVVVVVVVVVVAAAFASILVGTLFMEETRVFILRTIVEGSFSLDNDFHSFPSIMTFSILFPPVIVPTEKKYVTFHSHQQYGS